MEFADINDRLLRQHVKLVNNAEVFSLLQGTDPCHFVDDDKSTLLHLAAEHGNLDLAQCLLDLGADVDAQNNFGQTPIMLAIEGYNAKEVVRLLLNANADIYIPDARGKCTLGKAFNLLGEVNANIRRQILKSVTAESLRKSPYTKTKVFHDDCTLDHFSQLRNVEIMRALLDMGSPINAKNFSSAGTALHEAVNHLAVDIVQLLVERGADVNAKDAQNKKPLALFPSDIEDGEKCKIVKILLDAGTVLINDDYRESLMKLILSEGSQQTIRAVLQSKTDLYVRNKTLNMPIEYIFDNYNSTVPEELESIDIDINISLNHESTLLHYAAAKGNPGFTKLLLKRGADVNAKSSQNQSPLFMATNPIVVCMEMPGTDGFVVLGKKLIARFECISILLEYGADPQIFTKDMNYECIENFHHSSFSHLTAGLMRPIFDLLTLEEANGRPIDEFMLGEIQKSREFWLIFDSNRKILETMKEIMIDEGVNLFEFLVGKRVSRYAESETITANLTRMLGDDIDSYYYRRLQFNFVKLAKLIAINDIFEDFYHISAIGIAEKIVEYLCCGK